MDKSVLIQKHIRDNADELQSFMRDLSVWEKEMKRKETQDSIETPQSFPPIRKKPKSNESTTKTVDVQTSSSASESKPKKISAYDYRAWEKLDVRTASQLIKFWDNEKTKRKRIQANAKMKSLAAPYPHYAEPNFSGVENADINVFLETSVDTGTNGLHNSYMDTEDIKPFDFESHNGIDRELEKNIDEMSMSTSKGPAAIEYDAFTNKCHEPPSENGDCPSYSSASFNQSHHHSVNHADSPFERKRPHTESERRDYGSKFQQERDEMQRQHEKEMNALRLEEMKVRVELAKKELELKERHVELENKKIESLVEKEKFERAKEAIELDVLRRKLE